MIRNILNTVPFTAKFTLNLSEPAKLVAMQEYSPLCWAWIESMVKVLIRLPISIIEIPDSSWISFPLCNQFILTGLSPFMMVQVSEPVSPTFMLSCAKLKGVICGLTAKNQVRCITKLVPQQQKIIWHQFILNRAN